MKYDTSPLSIETSDVEFRSLDQELRFVPDDSDTISTSISRPIEADSRDQLEAVARIDVPITGFETFIEQRPEKRPLSGSRSATRNFNAGSFAAIFLLAILSAFAGGSAVYILMPKLESAPPEMPASSPPVSELNTSASFVGRVPADTAAEEPLVPHEPANRVERQGKASVPSAARSAPASVEPNTENALANESIDSGSGSGTEAGTRDQIEASSPRREAEVGSHVVERQNGRTPKARCADGTYSFTPSSSAACSGRGGVSEWIGNGNAPPATPVKQSAYVLGPRGGCYYLDGSGKKIYVEKKYCS